jgi:hypothetical protein
MPTSTSADDAADELPAARPQRPASSRLRVLLLRRTRGEHARQQRSRARVAREAASAQRRQLLEVDRVHTIACHRAFQALAAAMDVRLDLCHRNPSAAAISL